MKELSRKINNSTNLQVCQEVNPLATDLIEELFVPLLLAVLVLLLHVLGEVEDGVKQESTQTTQQAPLLLVCVREDHMEFTQTLMAPTGEHCQHGAQGDLGHPDLSPQLPQ